MTSVHLPLPRHPSVASSPLVLPLLHPPRLGHLMLVAGKVATQLDLNDTFRIVINNGAKAGQSVFHLHLHLLSGRSLNWPPG